jgi:hypothetical protein
MENIVAIALLVWPASTNRRISISRGVKSDKFAMFSS